MLAVLDCSRWFFNNETPQLLAAARGCRWVAVGFRSQRSLVKPTRTHESYAQCCVLPISGVCKGLAKRPHIAPSLIEIQAAARGSLVGFVHVLDQSWHARILGNSLQ